jgi:uncharacterized membrane protein YcaP (DUF421 family)
MSEGLVRVVTSIFGGDTPDAPLASTQIAARGAVIYVAGLILVRLGKSRLLSRATPLDVILAFVLGSVLSRGINGSAGITGSIVAAATLIAMHWAFTELAFRSHWWGRLIKGHAHVLVEDGRILWENMHRAHISKHDLDEELRLNANVADVNEVQIAVKERSGEVGVVKRKVRPHVVDVTVQEGVQSIRIVIE